MQNGKSVAKNVSPRSSIFISLRYWACLKQFMFHYVCVYIYIHTTQLPESVFLAVVSTLGRLYIQNSHRSKRILTETRLADRILSCFIKVSATMQPTTMRCNAAAGLAGGHTENRPLHIHYTSLYISMILH